MASSNGNSSGSTQIQNSGSEDGLVDQRKRKRMESNRESARRSRMRKQKHVDDLMAQAEQIKNDNAEILTTINVTTQRFVQVETENSVLRVQVSELSQRLDSLNEIINFINSDGNCVSGLCEFEQPDFMNNPWNMAYVNQQAIMADMFQY